MTNHHRDLLRRLAPATAFAGLLLGSACLASTDVELPELVGDWTATEARVADPANLNETLDIIALGWEAGISIEADGIYTFTILKPGEVPDVRTGTVTVENGKDLVLTNEQGQTGRGEVFLEDDQVAFMFDEFTGITGDIYGTGEPIPVTLLLVMERQ
jgi:hypothetical protein